MPSATYEDPRTGEQIRVREQNMPRYHYNYYEGRPASPRAPYDDRVGGARSDLTRKNLQDYNDYEYSRRKINRDNYNDPEPRRSRRRSSSSSRASSPPRHRSARRDRDGKDRRGRSVSVNGRDERKKDDFFDRTFDTSLNGGIAAAAGAGLGAIAAHSFRGSDPRRRKDDHTWRTVGGGAVGAALANAAGKRYSRSLDNRREERRRRSESRT